MLTIATWNVNSISVRLGALLKFLKDRTPEVLLLQETKCVSGAFPWSSIENMGYQCAVVGQKALNGVAVISKHPISDVVTALPGDQEDYQARYIECNITVKDQDFRVASIYVPNGSDEEKFRYKLKFFDRLRAHSQKLLREERPLVLGGDYNVAPFDIDVYSPEALENSVCFRQEEKDKMRSLLHMGLIDAFRISNTQKQQFSWWDYRGNGWQYNRGMRIDHILLSPVAADLLSSCEIYTDFRNQHRPSDHTPVACSFLIN
ncbi:exodeoxyribonuclease III [Rickettsiales bacterium]|nr:exodeoxyribonuclease III [Rickettsiales bacterium]